MKKCTKCGVMKPKSEFSKNKRAKDGLCYTCKSCQQAYEREHRLKYPEKRMKYIKDNGEKLRAYQKDTYHDYKTFIHTLKTPCVKCGENRHYLIQFHHIDPKEKKFELTIRHSHNSVTDEVKKCVCLCSNCHDEFHYFYGKKPDNPVENLTDYLGDDPYKVQQTQKRIVELLERKEVKNEI